MLVDPRGRILCAGPSTNKKGKAGLLELAGVRRENSRRRRSEWDREHLFSLHLFSSGPLKLTHSLDFSSGVETKADCKAAAFVHFSSPTLRRARSLTFVSLFHPSVVP